MKQAPHDLRDYLFDELTAVERADVESYLAAEPAAREELSRLRMTCEAVKALPAEEPPRRIAFVSDKIFEPSLAARALRWLRLDGPRFALGMSALLAVLFVGLWATEPRLTVAADGWTVAFGPAPTAVEPTPVVVPQPQPALDEARVRALFEEVAAASEARQRQAAEEMVRTASAETRAELKGDIQAAQEDMLSGLRIVQGNYDKLFKELTQVAVAR
ncbi:MAG: hypothetical protein GC160_11195 [Acidobacteria bacterium]|nr:hypothetical protein [Acidobacteriota bacterium]